MYSPLGASVATPTVVSEVEADFLIVYLCSIEGSRCSFEGKSLPRDARWTIRPKMVSRMRSCIASDSRREQDRRLRDLKGVINEKFTQAKLMREDRSHIGSLLPR